MGLVGHALSRTDDDKQAGIFLYELFLCPYACNSSLLTIHPLIYQGRVLMDRRSRFEELTFNKEVGWC